MEKKDALSITAAILTQAVISHLPPGTLTMVRMPDQVSAETQKLYEKIYEKLLEYHEKT